MDGHILLHLLPPSPPSLGWPHSRQGCLPEMKSTGLSWLKANFLPSFLSLLAEVTALEAQEQSTLPSSPQALTKHLGLLLTGDVHFLFKIFLIIFNYVLS